MKRLLLLLVLVLFAAIALGRWMAADSGYLLIIRNDLQIDMTLGFAILVALLAAVALVVVTLLFAALWEVVEPFRASRRWKRNLAAQRLRSGFIQLVDGEYEKAERLLVASAEQGDWPLAGWLLAAQSAREKGDHGQSRLYLEKACSDRRGRLVAGLLNARYALDDGEPQRAREELKLLAEMAPLNKRILITYADLLESEKRWQPLCDLMPRLKRAFGEQQMLKRERRAWMALMQETACKPGFNNIDSRREELRKLWKDVPVQIKDEPAMVARYAGFLAQLGAGKGALNLVKSRLQVRWDDRLPPVLEAIDDISPDDLLPVLEGWLVERPGSAAVLVTAGRVALKARLWGKAQSFFEAAANSNQSATALGELARLYHALGDSSKAEKVLARRVKQLQGELPDLPMP